MGLVLAPALLLAAPAAADTSFEGPDPAAMSSPEMVAANAVAIAVAAVQQAELQSPEAVAERAESADAYAGLSGSEASDLAAETFAPLGEPTWQPPEMPDGMEIVSYEGKTSMLVAPEGSIDPSDPPETVPVGTDLSNFSTDGRVIESTMPIRAREGAEGLQPVDPTLIDSGDHVEPTNATVEAEIPDDLADGIELPELEISLLPEGADGASDAELIGTDKLFYAGVATDTDFLATPTPIGVETFLQLRSADSPETHSVEVGLPAGGSIHGAADGTGAVIEDSEGPVASVLPPTAFDADGTPVAVEMSTQGSSIVLEVDHRAGDYHYPILVDPVTQAYNWSSSGATCPGAGSTGNVGWWFETTQPTKFAAAACAQTFGLVNMNVANETFAANDYSQWIWKPPAYTTIQGVTFSNTIHSAVSSCANFGLYNQATSSWQSSNINESNRCSSWSNVNKSYSTTAAAEQNLAVMGLSFPTAGPRASAWDSSSAVTLTLNDVHNPWLSSVSPTQSGNWVDDTEGSTTRTYNPTMTFDDLR